MVISSRSIVPPAVMCGAAHAGVPAAARAQPSGQGARPKDAREVPRMRSEGTSRRFDQVAAADRMSRCLPSRSVPQSVFEGRPDFDPLGFPKVVFVETPALDWRERLALSVRFDRRGVAHLQWAFE